MLWTIHQAAQAFRTGQLSPVELVDFCREQHAAYEANVRAWVFVDWDHAREQAEARQLELRRGYDRGPLHGIPLGIKDIIDVYDWPTAAGSPRWKDAHARHDATVVARLRQAGAVILGKTVTTAYASFDPPPTRNPWNRAHTPGGSSSGSAAAVATLTCLGSLGSQTGGSITRPASYCGVASCKPTFGRVSVKGVLPLAHSLDHIGPMARCVRDLAPLLKSIAGPDPFDPEASTVPVSDYTVQALAPVTRPLRLGRLRGLFQQRADPEVRQTLDRVCEELRAAGAIIEELALPASFSEVVERHRVLMAVEAAAYHERRFRRHPEEYPPCVSGLLQEGLLCSAAEYARCKEHQQLLTQQMAGIASSVDALLTPATTGPAPSAETTGDPAFNSPWSYVGLPTVSFTVAFSTNGLPLSLQLAGAPWNEGSLLQVAHWCEERVGIEVNLPPRG